MTTAVSPVLDRLRRTRVRPTEVVRAAYGLVELVAPAAPAGRVLGVRRDRTERGVARLLGARHLAQAVLTTLADSPRARLVGGGVDALHAVTIAGWAVADRRRGRQAWAEALTATLFAAAELGPSLPPLVRGRGSVSDSLAAAAGRSTTAGAMMGVSADGSSPVVRAAPNPERERRTRAALRQRAVADVAERGRGRATGDLIRELQSELARRGLPPEPRPWLRAVASDAAMGHLYVISEEAVRDAGLEMPTVTAAADGAALPGAGPDGPGRPGNHRANHPGTPETQR